MEEEEDVWVDASDATELQVFKCDSVSNEPKRGSGLIKGNRSLVFIRTINHKRNYYLQSNLLFVASGPPLILFLLLFILFLSLFLTSFLLYFNVLVPVDLAKCTSLVYRGIQKAYV